jgi:hypothetical protein
MYYQVILPAGNLLTVYLDLIEDLWYVQQAGEAKRLTQPVPVLIPDRASETTVAVSRDAGEKHGVA